MRRILVTGGAGFIGSNFIYEALQQGYEILNLDALTYAGNLANLKEAEKNRHYHFVRASITDSALLHRTFKEFGPHCVIHLAAESHVDRSIDAPDIFIETNISGTFTLLKQALNYFNHLPSAEARRFRFVQVSTDEVYGSIAEGAFTEESQYQPNSPYSASKAAGDHLARAFFQTYQLPTIVTNCTNNYGPYQFPEKLIPLMTLNALAGKTLPVYGDGKNIRDWLHVLDHCKALLLVSERGLPGRPYNISAENRLSNLELVNGLCELLDSQYPRSKGVSYKDLIHFVKDRPGHDERYAMSARRIRDELGWKPSISMQEGLLATVQWYVDHGDWCEAIRDNTYSGERLGAFDGHKHKS